MDRHHRAIHRANGRTRLPTPKTETLQRFTIRAFRFGVDESVVVDVLPEASSPWGWSRVFIAENAADQSCIGAALMVADGLRPRTLIRSRPAADDVDRALLAQVLQTARKQGSPAIRAWSPVDPNLPVAQWWTRLGFRLSEPTLVYEVDLATYIETLAPLHERLKRSGRIPPGVEAMPLAAAALDPVAALRVSEIGGDIRNFRAQLQADPTRGGFAQDVSTVLCLEDEVIAICLVRREDAETVMIDSVAVDPRWRNSWANIVVRLACAEHGPPNGISRLRFAADPKHKDTVKAATRAGARVLARWATPYHPTNDRARVVAETTA